MPRKKRVPPICGVYEAAQILNLSEQRIRGLIAEGRFPEGVRLKCGWIFLEEDIRAFALIERPQGAAGHRK